MQNMGHIKAEGSGQCQAFLHCVNLNKQARAPGNANCASRDRPREPCCVRPEVCGAFSPSDTQSHNTQFYKLLLSSLMQHLLSNLSPCPPIYVPYDNRLPPKVSPTIFLNNLLFSRIASCNTFCELLPDIRAEWTWWVNVKWTVDTTPIVDYFPMQYLLFL